MFIHIFIHRSYLFFMLYAENIYSDEDDIDDVPNIYIKGLCIYIYICIVSFINPLSYCRLRIFIMMKMIAMTWLMMI
jgi:hypothetical protein